MKADITRSTYNKKKKYVKVNAQQGRIQVDADWNEQLDIQENFNKTLLCDVVGKSGTPDDNPGFEIVLNGKSFTIGKGRYYIDGIICENDSDKSVDALSQEDLPWYNNSISPLFRDNSILRTDAGDFFVYLDVWQRHITSLEDPDLLEPALGRTDTTTRIKTVWQVKTLKKATASDKFELEVPNSTGALNVRLNPDRPEYTGDENRLYRVEIHRGGKLVNKSGKIVDNGAKSEEVTFKWSRENAVVATKIIGKPQLTGDVWRIVVEKRGKDDLCNFKKGQWVEVTDEYCELWNMPGQFLKLEDVEENSQENQVTLTVKFSSDSLLAYIVGKDGYVTKIPKVRRWNIPEDKWSMRGYVMDPVIQTRPDPNAVSPIGYVTTSDGYIVLEDGIQLRFEPGEYVTGDYWLIPARTVTKNIEWAITPTTPVLPSVTKHHYCPLAILKRNSDGTLAFVSDKRVFFSPATSSSVKSVFSPNASSLTFYRISGDDQKITPNNVYLSTASPGTPISLRVGVKIDNLELLGQEFQNRLQVRFEVISHEDGVAVGSLRSASTTGTGATSISVSLNTDGTASCDWIFLNSKDWTTAENDKVTRGGQRVSATLMYMPENSSSWMPYLVAPIIFNASFAQPELQYERGDGQNINAFNTQTTMPSPTQLRVSLKISGLPWGTAHAKLWRAKTKFTITESNDIASIPTAQRSVIKDFNDVGVAVSSWVNPSSSLVYQQIKAELVAYNNTNLVFGSALYFNANSAITQGLAAATTGVIKIPTSSYGSTNPLLSAPIPHALKNVGEAPPAIILSALSATTDSSLTDAQTKTTNVGSFDPCGLYNYTNMSPRAGHILPPRFKAVEVNQTSFRILAEPPFPWSQPWYIRWWAISAQHTNLQSPTFTAVKMPTIDILERGISTRLLSYDCVRRIIVIDDNLPDTVKSVQANLKLHLPSGYVINSCGEALKRITGSVNGKNDVVHYAAEFCTPFKQANNVSTVGSDGLNLLRVKTTDLDSYYDKSLKTRLMLTVEYSCKLYPEFARDSTTIAVTAECADTFDIIPPT
jgi:hypothetical protein